MLEKKLASLDFLDGDRLYLIISLEKEVVDRICVPWKDALIVKFLGKDVGFFTM